MIGNGGVDQAAAAFRRHGADLDFDLAVILGSGLGAAAERFPSQGSMLYSELPGFPESGVAGHAGRLVAADIGGWQVLFFQGRLHLYEGFDVRQAVLPVRLAAELGCRRILLSSAVGGINEAFRPGDFLYVADHLNLTGANPLRGERDDPFLDLSRLYVQEFFPPLEQAARGRGIGLHRGVLAAVPGPSYETPAEVRALAMLGADAVSMSTVPEAIRARYEGMAVAGLSCIANPAAGLGAARLQHAEVLAAGRNAAGDFAWLLERLIGIWQTF